MESTEQVESDPPAGRALYEGFGNALSFAFEFVAVVGLGFLVGRWLGGTAGGAIGLIIAWIGSSLRLYYRYAGTESPLARAKAKANSEKSS